MREASVEYELQQLSGSFNVKMGVLHRDTLAPFPFFPVFDSVITSITDCTKCGISLCHDEETYMSEFDFAHYIALLDTNLKTAKKRICRLVEEVGNVGE